MNPHVPNIPGLGLLGSAGAECPLENYPAPCRPS